jgi:phospholipid/cholesterol/gamma-HCH transport system substrate-binding protein
MERQANYVAVGAISIALVIAALISIVWLANWQFNRKYDVYRINFHGPVSGLSRGGDVQFNGIKLGTILDIRLDEKDPNKVVTDIQLEHGTPVRVDSLARTQAQGITGVRYVQISPGTPSKALLRKVSRTRPPVIQAAPGRFDELVQDVSKLMDEGAKALTNVNRLLSDKNIHTISQSINDVGAFTGELRERRTLFARLDRAAADLEGAVSSARGSLGGQNGTLARVNASAEELRRLLGDARLLVGRADGSFADISSTTVPQLNAALASIQQASASINELAADIRQDPRAALARPSGKEVEIPK